MTPVPGRTPLLAAAVLAVPAGAAAQERIPTVHEVPARAVAAALSVMGERAQAGVDPRLAHLTIGMTTGRKRDLTHALFVIDGVPMKDAGEPEDLDPADIATVEVVHGPAARVTYGARAADGVVLITTMRGPGKRSR